MNICDIARQVADEVDHYAAQILSSIGEAAEDPEPLRHQGLRWRLLRLATASPLETYRYRVISEPYRQWVDRPGRTPAEQRASVVYRTSSHTVIAYVDPGLSATCSPLQIAEMAVGAALGYTVSLAPLAPLINEAISGGLDARSIAADLATVINRQIARGLSIARPAAYLEPRMLDLVRQKKLCAFQTPAAAHVEAHPQPDADPIESAAWAAYVDSLGLSDDERETWFDPIKIYLDDGRRLVAAAPSAHFEFTLDQSYHLTDRLPTLEWYRHPAQLSGSIK